MWVLSGGQGRKRAFSAPGRGCELQMICCLPEEKEEGEKEEGEKEKGGMERKGGGRRGGGEGERQE